MKRIILRKLLAERLLYKVPEVHEVRDESAAQSPDPQYGLQYHRMFPQQMHRNRHIFDFAAFINCKVFGYAAQPCEFTGFPFIAVSGSQRFIKRILCDFFRQGLIFDDCHHVRVNLQVIGIVQFFIIQNRSPPFYTD